MYVVILTTNVFLVLLNKDNARISNFSLPAIFLMIIMIIHAAMSYVLRHKGNYLPFGRHHNPFTTDKDYTFDELYIKRFFIMLKIYCLAIPFFIPQIFLTSTNFESLWALCTFFSPQVVYVIMGIINTLKEVKEYKAKKEQLEKERLLQEQREELGKWK
ncbi:MAG: hypothetical protein IJU20_08560 [Clostridia bacterium]|nr:hypothetical protein [Clostridia bacterium]